MTTTLQLADFDHPIVQQKAAEFFASDKHPRWNAIQSMSYPFLAFLANRNVGRLRGE